MKNRTCILLLGCLFLVSCGEEEVSDPSFSSRFSICNSSLPDCLGKNGDYCLFGYKWGHTPLSFESGINKDGPSTPGGEITFSIQENNGLIQTHRQIDLPSKDFSTLPSCSKFELRRAFETWSNSADFTLNELDQNSYADIRIFVAEIVQSGIGYPNFQNDDCRVLKGTLIIKENISIRDCETLYLYFLHEIGHVLGLGHINTANVMNPDFRDFDLDGLQRGDSLGVQSMYGNN